MRIYRSEQEIIQNLKDAGCNEDTIKSFMKNFQCGEQHTATKLLQDQRCCLLDDLHQNQRRIDCLDYLLFVLKKEYKSENSKK